MLFTLALVLELDLCHVFLHGFQIIRLYHRSALTWYENSVDLHDECCNFGRCRHAEATVSEC
jgi:hypothetical protein